MCLITYWKKPKTAKEDIVCYKFLLNIAHYLYSPFRLMQYNIGLNEANKNTHIEISRRIFRPKYSIYGGFLHCYTNYSPITIRDFYMPGVFYKCIIPKGAKYYISCNKKEICADKLTILRNYLKLL